MKSVSIEIGSVAVEGVPSGTRNGEVIGRAIEREMGRRLAEPGVLAGVSPRALAMIRLGDSRLPPGATDAQIGEAVAAALDKALRKRRRR